MASEDGGSSRMVRVLWYSRIYVLGSILLMRSQEQLQGVQALLSSTIMTRHTRHTHHARQAFVPAIQQVQIMITKKSTTQLFSKMEDDSDARNNTVAVLSAKRPVEQQSQQLELSRECDLLAITSDCEDLSVSLSSRRKWTEEEEEDGSGVVEIVAPSVTEEVLAGVVVALATVPTSIAYAGIAGVDPLTGLWSSVLVGGVLAVTAPGVMAGAAGVVAVPMGVLAASSTSGAALIPLAALGAGLLEGLFGALRLGGLMEFITTPTMDGLLNGFGVYLLESQKKVLQSGGVWLAPDQIVPTAGAMALTAVLAGWALPKLRDASSEWGDIPGMGVFRAIPPALGALVSVSCLSNVLGLDLATLSDVAAPHTFDGGMASLPHWPPQLPPTLLNDPSSLLEVAPTAFSVALIGVLETLLAARLVDGAIASDRQIMVNTNNSNSNNDEGSLAKNEDTSSGSNSDANVVCLGLGVGNVLSASLGGFGGCGLLPQTILSIQSGGRTALSGLSYAMALALSTVVAGPLIGEIPRGVVAGLMVVVASNTIQWKGTQSTLTAALLPSPQQESNTNINDDDNSNNDDDNNGETSIITNSERANALALVAASIICYKGEFGIGVLLAAAICAAGVAMDKKDQDA